uniref:Farnesoic acid O-methyl transferase domain-containing protein n=1 Tax=Vespula pensylvanica TaxID=30213 RepID=A0A834JT17_VESPE|nr:hypothetical protein H0235_017443 [Vespula pensylvanica]
MTNSLNDTNLLAVMLITNTVRPTLLDKANLETLIFSRVVASLSKNILLAETFSDYLNTFHHQNVPGLSKHPNLLITTRRTDLWRRFSKIATGTPVESLLSDRTLKSYSLEREITACSPIITLKRSAHLDKKYFQDHLSLTNNLVNLAALSTEDKLEYNFYPVTSGQVQFRVKAPNDAHIALTTGPHEGEPMYEVFIGGWGNSKSVIRKNRTKPEVAERETPGILTADDFRGFWIRWRDGEITVGKEGESNAFLSYTDPEPFGIGYFGACTGWGASGEWLIEGKPFKSTLVPGICKLGMVTYRVGSSTAYAALYYFNAVLLFTENNVFEVVGEEIVW